MARRPRPQRTDDQIRAHEPHMRLLVAVAGGRVSRTGPNATAIAAPHMLGDENVRASLHALARDDLIDLPISGPPRLAARGFRVLNGG